MAYSHTYRKIQKYLHRGMHGGKHGNTSKWIINEGKEDEKILDYAMGDVIFLNYGDTITCITASGGGYGNPLEREIWKKLKRMLKWA